MCAWRACPGRVATRPTRSPLTRSPPGAWPPAPSRSSAAGRGAFDLLTVCGLALLRQADVVVVDRLGPAGLTELLGDRVEVIGVGKTPGHPSMRQGEIEAVLVEQARAGKRVVGLKGGDPFVLGRGGEEVLACRAAGVPVQVVPGVTSSIAGPAAGDIPVTHRGAAVAVHSPRPSSTASTPRRPWRWSRARPPMPRAPCAGPSRRSRRSSRTRASASRP